MVEHANMGYHGRTHGAQLHVSHATIQTGRLTFQQCVLVPRAIELSRACPRPLEFATPPLVYPMCPFFLPTPEK